MAKIHVTPRSQRARYKHKGKVYTFGDVFEVEETDKNIIAGIKVWALRKVSVPKEEVTVDSKKSSQKK